MSVLALRCTSYVAIRFNFRFPKLQFTQHRWCRTITLIVLLFLYISYNIIMHVVYILIRSGFKGLPKVLLYVIYINVRTSICILSPKMLVKNANIIKMLSLCQRVRQSVTKNNKGKVKKDRSNQDKEQSENQYTSEM